MRSSAPQYTATETLYQDGRTTLYRAIREADRRPVVFKVLDPRRCRPKDLERLRREYDFGTSLDLRTAVRPLALETYQGMPALVLEDFGGEPLDRLLGAPMPVERFLDLAVPIAGAVSDVHRQGVVHKDLKPANILVDPTTLEVKIADFGLAIRLPREQQTAQPPQLIEGSLPYMSPEQTGRMNRAVDSRTDLYSLGVTFYQMLTGRLPFEARDPLEWVHCHVARAPASPSQLVPDVPEAISRIVLKLLAKMADDRYQSARGLRHDLERCLEQWRWKGKIDPFVLGARDASDSLQVPQRLHGRDEEIARLLSALDRVVARGTPELVLVSGYSGIGKSSLVRELLRPLVRERGLFLEGKFDPYARDIPYSTIVQAFNELVLGILVEDEGSRDRWRGVIQKALGASGRLITDLIPPLVLLIGEPPPVPELPPAEAERRFRRVLCDFVGSFTQGEHPLVLFLDDLQWADPGSLGLVEALTADRGTSHLLLIGAYRDNEVSPSHPLMRTVERIRKAPAVVTDVALSPLHMDHVLQLVAEAVRGSPQKARPLAALVQKKTGGNPFFVVQFLTTLSQERLLWFDEAESAWRWDLMQIEKKDYTDNVVDFLVRKLTALPTATQEVLETAAGIGFRVPGAILASAHGAPEEETLHSLWDAIREGLVVHAADGYVFAHDRVRQAAYSLIPEGRRSEVHLKIGRLLLEKTPSSRIDENIFDIVTQLNLGRSLLTDPGERTRLAELNLRAGHKAMAAAAYVSAIPYLAAGEALLPPDGWEAKYELTYGLKIERARCEWLCGNFDAAEDLLVALLAHARSRADRAAVYRVKIHLYTTRGEFEQVARTALAACSTLFGIDLALHPGEAALREAAERTWRELGDRSIEDLLDLPAMADPDMQAAVALLSASLPAAYFTDPNLHDLMCCQVVSLSLRCGNTGFSPHGYVTFGATLGRVFERWEEAYRFGKLACELVEKRGIVEGQASTYYTVGSFINFWVRPVREVVPFFYKALRAAVEHGDMNHACYAALAIVMCRLIAGDPLADVAAEAAAQLDLTRRAKYSDIQVAVAAVGRYVRSLLAHPDLETSELDADTGSHGPLVHYTYKALAHLLLGDHENAALASRKAGALAEAGAGRGQIQQAEYCYVRALSLAAHLEHVTVEERPEHLAMLAACQEQLRRWQQHCPANFRDRYALISAEMARIQGRDPEAMRLYEEAIRSARENGFVHNQGIAFELASRFHRSRGFDLIADTYLREARTCYARWGADGKVRQIDQLHPRLLEARPLGPTASFAVRAEQIDLLSVVKASQTISSEIQIEKLVGTLLRITLEQGGAQKGYLILARDGGLSIEAEATLEEKGVATRILPSLPLESSPLVPVSLVHYAQLTREAVILDDAAASAGKFASDAYIARQRPRSVLCLPIMRQAKLVGLLCLENDLAAGAFTPDRLAALTLLASQAAISMENALLLSQERTARAAAEEAERRSAFLAEAGALLSESLDYEETLVRLGRLCVRSLADWCVIDIVEDGVIRRLAGAHADPAKEPLLRRLQVSYPPRRDSPHPAARVLRTGQALLLSELSDDRIRGLCEDDEHARLVLELGTRSGVTVPLVARGTTLGALTLGSGAPGRYGRADLELAEELAHRAAIAIDNARLHRETQRAVRMRDEFLMVASHELRTPMTSLTLSLQALKAAAPPGRPVEPQAMSRSVGLAARQGQRLNRLVGDLLDVSRIEAGRLPLDLSDVELGAVVRDVVERFEPDLTRAGCPVSIQGDAPVVGRWDRSRIDQVVTNLLSNAMKFGAGKPVEILLGEEAGMARLVIRDQGIGIDPAQQARIFERFARVAPIQHYGGLGLGLYIGRRIVEAHGGTIRVVSEPGTGSTFTVELPCGGPGDAGQGDE